MKILRWILIILAVLIMALLAFLWYMGVFATVKVTEQKVGPYMLVYEKYVGPYSNTGQILQKVYGALKKEGITTTKGFGIYLNNPNQTSPDKLESEIGCVLENKDLNRVGELKKKKFLVKKWEEQNCLVVELPIRNNLSYMIGPFKAYPELNKALNAKKYKMTGCLELYDMAAMKTFYIFAIAK